LRECAAIASRLCRVSFFQNVPTWDFTVSPANAELLPGTAKLTTCGDHLLIRGLADV